MKIAELSQISGLNYNTISNLYYDKTKGIDFDTLDKICWALECNAHDLLEYTPDK